LWPLAGKMHSLVNGCVKDERASVAKGHRYWRKWKAFRKYTAGGSDNTGRAASNRSDSDGAYFDVRAEWTENEGSASRWRWIRGHGEVRSAVRGKEERTAKHLPCATISICKRAEFGRIGAEEKK